MSIHRNFQSNGVKCSVTRSVDNVYQVDILTLSVDKIFGNKNAIKTEFVIEKNYPLISHEKMSLKQKFTI